MFNILKCAAVFVVMLAPVTRAAEIDAIAYNAIFNYRVATTPEGLAEKAAAYFMVQRYNQLADARVNGGLLTDSMRSQLEQDTVAFLRGAREMVRETQGDFSQANSQTYLAVQKAMGNLVDAIPNADVKLIAAKSGAQIILGAGFDGYESLRNTNLAVTAGENLMKTEGIDGANVGRMLYAYRIHDPLMAEAIDKVFRGFVRTSVTADADTMYLNNNDVGLFQQISKDVQAFKAGQISRAELDQKFRALRSSVIRNLGQFNQATAKRLDQGQAAAQKRFDQLQGAMDQQRERQERAEKIAEIREQAATLRGGVSALVQMGQMLKVDPATLNAVDRIGNASIQFSEVSQLFSMGGITAFAAGVGYVQAGLMVAQLFANQGPNPNQIILEQLAELRQEVRELRQIMVEGFRALDERLANLYALSAKNFEELGADVRDIARMSRNIQATLNDMQALMIQNRNDDRLTQYREQMAPCLPQTYTFSGGPRTTRTSSGMDCKEYVVQRAIMPAASPANQSTAHNAFQWNVSEFPFQSAYRFLGEYWVGHFDRSSLLPYLQASARNPEELLRLVSRDDVLPLQDSQAWALGVDDILRLQGSGVRTARGSAGDAGPLTLLARSGQNQKTYFANLVALPQGRDEFVLDRDLLGKALSRYEVLARSFAADAADFARDKTGKRFHPGRAFDQPFVNSTENPFKVAADFTGLCPSFSPTFTLSPFVYTDDVVAHLSVGNDELRGYASFATTKDGKLDGVDFPPNTLNTIGFDNRFRMAQAMNLGNFKVCISRAHLSQFAIDQVTHEYHRTERTGGRPGSDLSRVVGLTRHRHEKNISFSAGIAVRVTFQTFADARRGIMAQEYLVTERLVHYGPHQYTVDAKAKVQHGLTQLWGDSRTPNSFVVHFPKESIEIGAPSKLQASSREIDQLLTMRKPMFTGLIREETVRKQTGDELDTLYNVMRASLFLGAQPLWNQSGPSLISLFINDGRLPSREDILNMVLDRGLDDMEIVSIIQARVAQARKTIETLSSAPFVPHHMGIDSRLTVINSTQKGLQQR